MSLSSVRRRIKTLHEKRYHPPVLLSDADLELKARLEGSFHEFVKVMWPYGGSTRKYMDNWHMPVVCEHGEELYKGTMPYQIWNIPPRLSKSTIGCVMLPGWVWIQDPRSQFLYGSHSLDFARRDSLYCNRLISSDLYQRLWGDRVRIRQNVNNVDKFELTAGGIRQIVSVGASVTGKNADYIIIDDPNDVIQVKSEVLRKQTNSWWVEAASSRFNDLRNPRQLIIQQRTHWDDLTGHVVNKNLSKVTHLFIPMEYEPERPCVTGVIKSSQGKAWTDPRKENGELLWSDYINAELIKEIKENLPPSVYATQFQQRPSPAEGGIIKKEWFKAWKHSTWPDLTYVLQSWDTAIMDSDDACYSACTTWGVWQDDNGYNNLILLNAWRGRLQYPDLKEMIVRCSEDFLCQSLKGPIKNGRRPDMVLMENAANGMPLIQDLFRSGLRLTPFNPRHYGFKNTSGRIVDSSKHARATIASSWIEQGFVWIPYSKQSDFRFPHRYGEMFVEACIMFPNGDGADLVDSMSQALLKLMRGNDIYYKGQKPDDPVVNWKQDARHASRYLEKGSNLYGRV